jgi:hypothetical protein
MEAGGEQVAGPGGVRFGQRRGRWIGVVYVGAIRSFVIGTLKTGCDVELKGIDLRAKRDAAFRE